jgi:hypothetical protein
MEMFRELTIVHIKKNGSFGRTNEISILILLKGDHLST